MGSVCSTKFESCSLSNFWLNIRFFNQLLKYHLFDFSCSALINAQIYDVDVFVAKKIFRKIENFASLLFLVWALESGTVNSLKKLKILKFETLFC